MSVPAIAERSGENTGQNTGNRNLRTPWQKGQSGNPGGRPKGIVRAVKERVGDDGRSLVEFMADVLQDETAKLEHRMRAAEWLADRGFGRPTQVVAGEGDQPVRIVVASMFGAAVDVDLGAAEVGELPEAGAPVGYGS